MSDEGQQVNNALMRRWGKAMMEHINGRKHVARMQDIVEHVTL